MIISSTIAESALHVAKRRSTGTHKDVTDYIKSFWAWLVSLAGIVGLYIGSIAVHLTKYFWIVVALAAALAGAKPIWTAVKEGSKRIRTYRSLVQRVAAAETKVEQLEAERKGFPDRIREERNAGFNEAWAEIEGSLRAGEMTNRRRKPRT